MEIFHSYHPYIIRIEVCDIFSPRTIRHAFLLPGHNYLWCNRVCLAVHFIAEFALRVHGFSEAYFIGYFQIWKSALWLETAEYLGLSWLHKYKNIILKLYMSLFTQNILLWAPLLFVMCSLYGIVTCSQISTLCVHQYNMEVFKIKVILRIKIEKKNRMMELREVRSAAM